MVLPAIGGTRTDPLVDGQPAGGGFGFLDRSDPMFGHQTYEDLNVVNGVDAATIGLPVQQVNDPMAQFGGFQSFLPGGEGQATLDQLGADFDQFAATLDPQLQQQIQEADVRAEATRSQLENAGLLSLANQFRRARSAANVDAARRGTIGGTFQQGQEEEARQAVQRGAGDVALSAAQAAEQQRLAELAPVFGFQQQLAEGSPLQGLARDLMLQDIQQRGQGAQGQFDINTTLENIRSGSDMNRAANINSALMGLATGVQGGIQGYQNRQYLNNMRGLYGFQTGPNIQNRMLPGGGLVQSNTQSGVSVNL